MKSVITVLLIFVVLMGSITSAHAQQPQLATYRETAQVLVDEKIQNQTTAFITLSSTSPLEMRVPTALDEKISNAANVTSVAITNANACVLGVTDQMCVVMTIYSPSLIRSYNITEIQSTAHAIGDTLINDINKAFLVDATFNSAFINPKGGLSQALGTSGSLVGNETISVVYTAPQEKSSYLFDQLTSILMPTQIRDADGFYDVAKKMAYSSNSTVTFAITPTANGQSIYQLQVSIHSPNKGEVTSIRPLDLFGVSALNRSSYFSGGFFPLNSLFEISIISNNDTTITSHGGDIAPTTFRNGQKIPTDLTQPGWIFDPDSGEQITGIYLFGTTTSVTSDDLALTIGSGGASQSYQSLTNSSSTSITTQTGPDYSTYVLIGIVIAGGAAVYLFMRRR
jgi:hypothetical protein